MFASYGMRSTGWYAIVGLGRPQRGLGSKGAKMFVLHRNCNTRLQGFKFVKVQGSRFKVSMFYDFQSFEVSRFQRFKC